MPRLKQGDEYLHNIILEYLVYPNAELKNNITEKIYVIFVVDEDGTMSDIHVEDYVNENLKNESIKVVKLLSEKSSWNPGYQLGKKVRIKCIIPIVFMGSETIED